MTPNNAIAFIAGLMFLIIVTLILCMSPILHDCNEDRLCYICDEIKLYDDDHDCKSLYETFENNKDFICKKKTKKIDNYYDVRDNKIIHDSDYITIKTLRYGKKKIIYTRLAPTRKAKQKYNQYKIHLATLELIDKNLKDNIKSNLHDNEYRCLSGAL